MELANRLQKRGYLTRATSRQDGRAVLLVLTRAGRGVLDRIERYSFSQLHEEAPKLSRSLRKILES